MNICFLEGDMSRKGGTERMTSWLANSLCEGHNIYILSLQLKEKVVFYTLKERIKHFVLPTVLGKLGIPQQIKNIHKFIKDNDIDILINVDIGSAVYGIPAIYGTKTKVITWEHANYFNNWNSKVFPYFRKFAAHYSDAMVVLTEQDRQNYMTNIPSKVPVYVIPNPVERRNTCYDVTSKVILSAGALLPIKGYDKVIEVAKKVFSIYPDWKWIICGEGIERQRLERLISEAGLEECVLLLGVVRDMESKYKEAAIVVMTSHMEGLPMVLLEAKSYGLPLVSFDIMTGPRDIITDGVNGYLISANNTNEMAEKIKILISNSNLRVEFSRNSKNDIDRFLPCGILRKWEEIFGGMIDER